MDPINTQTTGTQGTLAADNSLFQTDDVGEQFDTFLNLLVAQIKNQDPLSPLDSTQFVEQLATFTSLEQQAESNNTLTFLASLTDEFFGLAAAQWIGQTVEVESSFVPYSGEAVNYTADIPEDADTVIFVVHDRNGQAIYSEQIDPSDNSWSWDGTLSDGTQANTDVYGASIELYAGDQFLGHIAPSLITQVTEATVEDGELRLGFENRLSEFAKNVRKP
ncbi:flagellar hook assembly protein FlgD [Parvularcula sp. IMCC14364]|uniref:flagellar hook assembly protein FlgD n=1 Tax=Parvularcula sp. IMCC14364 TaxID=3067902 RepID=UPI00274292A9|nr:flagellar hook capping FlgD N-terminal domain-containing protein [Parvularcula sp. IMCC14364]